MSTAVADTPSQTPSAALLPMDVAAAAAEFITGHLLREPHRVDRQLGAELAGIYSARLAREWRAQYEIDQTEHTVIVLDIRHRSVVYRPR